jgi:hypothetical protein
MITVRIDREIITDNCDYTAIKFDCCRNNIVWDEYVAKYPNVQTLYFNDCSTPTSALLDLCGRINDLYIDDCQNEFLTACISRFNGRVLRVNFRRIKLIVPVFSVTRLVFCCFDNCVVSDEMIECIKGARLLEQLDLTHTDISDLQMRRVIDNITEMPTLKGFWVSGLSVENHERLRDVYRKGSMLTNVRIFPMFDTRHEFDWLTQFSESNWFQICVTLMASKELVSEIWHQLFSKYLPKPCG